MRHSLIFLPDFGGDCQKVGPHHPVRLPAKVGRDEPVLRSSGCEPREVARFSFCSSGSVGSSDYAPFHGASRIEIETDSAVRHLVFEKLGPLQKRASQRDAVDDVLNVIVVGFKEVRVVTAALDMLGVSCELVTSILLSEV